MANTKGRTMRAAAVVVLAVLTLITGNAATPSRTIIARPVQERIS